MFKGKFLSQTVVESKKVRSRVESLQETDAVIFALSCFERNRLFLAEVAVKNPRSRRTIQLTLSELDRVWTELATGRPFNIRISGRELIPPDEEMGTFDAVVLHTLGNALGDFVEAFNQRDDSGRLLASGLSDANVDLLDALHGEVEQSAQSRIELLATHELSTQNEDCRAIETRAPSVITLLKTRSQGSRLFGEVSTPG